MNKKILVIVIISVFLLAGSNTTAFINKKQNQNNDEHNFLLTDNFMSPNIKNSNVDDRLYEMQLNENKYIFSKGKNSISKIEVITGKDDGFNPAITDIAVWFEDLSDSEYDIDLIWSLYNVTNIGESYYVGTHMQFSISWYLLYPDGREELAWVDTYKEYSGGEPSYWDQGKSVYSVWCVGVVANSFEIPPQMKAILEIIDPVDAPDANPDDNIRIIPWTDAVSIFVEVVNLSGNPVKEASVMTEVAPHLSVGTTTNEKGKGRVSARPKEPLDEPHTYDLTAKKPYFNPLDSQTKTTEPVMEGQETHLEFELDVEGEKGKSNNLVVNLLERILERFRDSTDDSDSTDGQQSSSLLTQVLQSIFGRSTVPDAQTPTSTPMFPIIRELLSGLR